MGVFFEDFMVATSAGREVVNVTPQVEAIVRRSKFQNGLVLVFTQHTTTALIINEDETGLRHDYLELVVALYDRPGYHHDQIDRNAASHLAASFAGASVILPIRAGHLVRGTWQSILFLELDGPRQRTLTCQIIAD